jgi:Carboxypeptidase regulatory-like domain
MNPIRLFVWTGVVLLWLGISDSGYSQSSGTIVGSVLDPSGARIPGASVSLDNRNAGIHRETVSNETGFYSFTALLPGEYEVSADLAGFEKVVRRATVNVGRDTTVDLAMKVGGLAESVDIVADAPQVNLVDSKVDGIINRAQVANLPLNGRNAYELAALVPGVRVEATSSRNTQVAISIAGARNNSVRVTVDGISAVDYTNGGTAQNFSQEVVQEFQVSTSNFDPAVGVTSAGAVNIVTRSGGNELHGTVFSYFRNNQYAAFPALGRPLPKPNPGNDPKLAAFNESQARPEFYRRQFGGTFSGPVIKNRLFWLASVEASRQTSVNTFDANFDEFQPLNVIQEQPLKNLTQNYRLDWRATGKHSLFLRFSRDGFESRRGAGLPSRDGQQHNRAYTALLGWTTIFSPTFISDVRLAFDRTHIILSPNPDAEEEARRFAPLLPLMGGVAVSGTNVTFGAPTNARNESLVPRLEFVDNFTYNRGKNTWKFGFDVERHPYWLYWQYDYPFNATAFNPRQARDAGISVPATFASVGDLMQLPLSTFSFGVGTTPLLPSYQRDRVWVRHRYRTYGGSSFRASPRLTLNWSLAYSYEDGVVNWDLPKPKSLTAVLNGRLHPTRRDKNNLSPIVGFAWDPIGDGRTVVRGGFGTYFDTFTTNPTSKERALIAPLGQSYVGVDGSFVTNPISGRGTLAFPTAQSNAAAGVFRLADLVRILPQIRGQLEQTVFTGKNTDPSVTNLDFFKSTNSGVGAGITSIVDPDLTMPYSMQSMLGFQHQVSNNFLVSVSGVYNTTKHTVFLWDVNRQFRPAAKGGPIDSNLNRIILAESGGYGLYKGLLIQANKAMSRGFQLATSYTLSSYKTLGEASSSVQSINYDNHRDGYGPNSNDRRHLLNVNAVFQLPLNFQFAVLNTVETSPPFRAFLSGLDLNGDGTRDDLLPGLTENSINRSQSVNDLTRLVAAFNSEYSGKRDSLGTMIRPVTLPEKFRTGDTRITQDVRVTKKFRFRETGSVDLIAEVFNLFNIANLTYAASAGNLYSSGFGQPNTRIGNLFGSGGPRAGQFALRFSF